MTDIVVPPEVLHRSAALQDVNIKQRLIDLLIVPWDQETEKASWRGEVWRESFDRRAFDGIQNHAGRVAVNREHVKGDTIGKAVHFDPTYQGGLFGRVKIVNTPRGDETLALVEEGMAFPSVGYRVKRPSDVRVDRRTMTRRVIRGFIDHIAMVEDPAYDGAEVLAVRAGPSGLVVAEQPPLLETPGLDELASDPLFEWAASRLRK